MPRLTVHDFLLAKGRRKLTQTFTMPSREAAACDAARIDVIVAAIDHNTAAESNAKAIRLAHEALAAGADAVYCGAYNLDRIAAMADARVPVIGHVGLVPYRDTWLGGKRAVGKTADEAVEVNRRTKTYEAAGAVAVEISGRKVIRLCRDAGIPVPDRIAVLGINNDELVCEMCDPPLSSLNLGLQRLGYLATERVLQRIDGRDDGPRMRLLPPGRVAERGSTRACGVDDPVLAAAMRYIDDHTAQRIGVEDVLDHLGVSRRSLELKFRRTLDTTPWKAIQLARVRRAEALLTDTELSIARVADLSGFTSSYQFSVMFKRSIGVSPTAYRAAGRAHG